MTLPPLAFPAFEAAPPPAYLDDPIWKTRMFRMAAYLSSRCSTDVVRLGPRVSLQHAHQFIRAIASIESNIAEGYSRSGSADQSRFYSYALGSLRESLAWIDAFGPVEWEPRAEYLNLLVQIRRQLLTALRAMREQAGKETRRPQGRPAHYRKSR